MLSSRTHSVCVRAAARAERVRVSCLRAIIGFCEVVKERVGGVEVLRPFLAPIVDSLITFIAQYHGGEVLALMLEAMCSVVSVSVPLSLQRGGNGSRPDIAVQFGASSEVRGNL